MAWIIEVIDQLERQCMTIRQPFDQRSGPAGDDFDHCRGGFATRLALDVGGEPIWTIDNPFHALKACARGRNEPGRQGG
jgi:hypothetical protein